MSDWDRMIQFNKQQNLKKALVNNLVDENGGVDDT